MSSVYEQITQFTRMLLIKLDLVYQKARLQSKLFKDLTDKLSGLTIKIEVV